MALCVDCVRVPVPSSRLSSSKQYSTFIESGGLAGISSAVVQGRVYRLSGNQRRSRRAQCDVDLTTDVTRSAARRHASLCVCGQLNWTQIAIYASRLLATYRPEPCPR